MHKYLISYSEKKLLEKILGEDVLRYISIVAFFIILGCLGGGEERFPISEGEVHPLNLTQPNLTGVTHSEHQEINGWVNESCEPSFSFSDLPPSGMMGKPVLFLVHARCAQGRVLSLMINERKEGEKEITSSEETVEFLIAPRSEGMKDIEITSDGGLIFSARWSVHPIGSRNTMGNANEHVSVKHWIATAFDVENEIEVRSIGAYMKRLYFQTLPQSEILAELREDDRGRPSESSIATASIPFNKTTMSENWVYFNFQDTVILSPGRYWVVLRVQHEDEDQIVADVVNIHYTFSGDTNIPGNDYTRQMTLEWSDEERRFVRGEWEPLPYNRTYTLIVSGIQR